MKEQQEKAEARKASAEQRREEGSFCLRLTDPGERIRDTRQLLTQIVLDDLKNEQDEGLGAIDEDDPEENAVEFEAWKASARHYALICLLLAD